MKTLSLRAAPLALALALLTACGASSSAPPAAPYAWRLPAGFPTPASPADNPVTDAKVELGRRLFYDRRLSVNGALACAGCHDHARAFTDGRPSAVGTTGQHHRRNAQGLANVGYLGPLTWANSLLPSLESQALVPMFGDNPVELGLAGRDELVLARLAGDAATSALFAAAFPEDAHPVSLGNVVKALGAFERTLVSGDAAFDRFEAGDASALSPAARRGRDLFFSPRLGCSACHAGLFFTSAVRLPGLPAGPPPFHNTGLYDEDGAGAYPAADPGLVEQTFDPADMGKFRVPSLRNVAVTAPYMHDGSLATLGDVIDHYAAGGRAALVRGRPSPLRDPRITGFTLAPGEKEDLTAFLESLTDTGFLTDPRFSDPFAP